MATRDAGTNRAGDLRAIDRRVDPSGATTPWTPLRDTVLSALTSQVWFDRACVWLLQPDHPSPDELLAQRGFGAPEIQAWCNGAHREATLITDALVAGRADGTLPETGLGTKATAGEHAAVHALPESHPQQRWWLAIVSRRARAFSEGERHSVDIALRQLQTSLNQPEAPGRARALAGHDDRPISTDLSFHQTTTRLGMPVRELLRRIRDIREQRWPALDDDVTHDMVIEVGEERFWVIFRRTRATDLPRAAQSLVELRPVGELAPPPVGVVSDVRIAQALAFLHDHFAENPSLEHMAAAVHVSPFHFHRVFTRLVGESPKRYLQLKQLQIASELLRRTHVPIRDIARLTGFTSHGHFNVTFQRVVGRTPTDHRLDA